jgi:hypothetical protein
VRSGHDRVEVRGEVARDGLMSEAVVGEPGEYEGSSTGKPTDQSLSGHTLASAGSPEVVAEPTRQRSGEATRRAWAVMGGLGCG